MGALSGIRSRAGAAYTLHVDPLARHLLTQAYNNAWANHRLLGACAQLGAAEFAAPRAGFFPSIKATLNHNLTVDWFYIDALERSLAGRPVMLSGTALAPPQLDDFFCANDAPLRVADFAALGFSEAAIWPAE